jgi:hypothetical protein
MFLANNKDRGKFCGFGLREQDDNELIGLCLYYLASTEIAEIMLLACREDARGVVLRHLMHRTWHEGAVGLIGRLEPKFLQAFSDHHCLMKAGDWAFVHAKDLNLVHIVNTGDAFISALEGELWLRSPMDRL